MTTKIELARIQEIVPPDDLRDKIIVSKGGKVYFWNPQELGSYIPASSPVVTDFRINSSQNSDILVSQTGYTTSPAINEKHYFLNIDANKSISRTVAAGGLVDTERSVPYEQPAINTTTGNTGNPYFLITSQYNNVEAFKMFDGRDDTQWISDTVGLQTVSVTLYRPIVAEKFVMRNATTTNHLVTLFRIEGCDTTGSWKTIVNVNGVDTRLENTGTNDYNEFISSDRKTLFKQFRITIYDNGMTPGLSRFNIIGKYVGAFFPNYHYDLYVAGKEDWQNPSAITISTIAEKPLLPEGYTYCMKIGWYETGWDEVAVKTFPTYDLSRWYLNTEPKGFMGV